MNEKEQADFVFGCFVGFCMTTSEIAIMFQKYGLDPNYDSAAACKQALREHVGEDRWKKGVRAIQNRAAVPDGLFNGERP